MLLRGAKNTALSWWQQKQKQTKTQTKLKYLQSCLYHFGLGGKLTWTNWETTTWVKFRQVKGRLLVGFGPVVLTLECASQWPRGLVKTYCGVPVLSVWFNRPGLGPKVLLMLLVWGGHTLRTTGLDHGLRFRPRSGISKEQRYEDLSKNWAGGEGISRP